MANNLVEYLAQLKASDPKRANWILDCPNVGTNDWGFGKVKLCKEIIAGTHVRYDFKSAYSTNPTISPVLSRAKTTVTAWWIPSRLYVPALRDGLPVKAGKTDYAFPTINFDYRSIRYLYDSDDSLPDPHKVGGLLPYVPANSIFSELRMWAPYFQPIGFAISSSIGDGTVYPEPKNAIPLLGYYDIFRNYVLNTQVDGAPIRIKGFSRRKFVSVISGREYYETQSPVDVWFTRERFDQLFRAVRANGNQYPLGEGTFDISLAFSDFFSISTGSYRFFAPLKNVLYESDDDDNILLDTVIAFNDNHFGEWRETYLADYFTAFLSNENVEYERSTARVQTDDDGVITMEQIYSAQKVQNYVRRTVFKNSDYSEFIDVQYGVTPSTTLTKPMFMGAVSTWLTFNDVIAQAQSGSDGDIESNNDLGSRASLGFGRMVTGKLRGNNDRPFVEFTAKEPGYFMVIETIVPEVSYWQGYDPMYDKRSLESLYYPAFDKDGYQDKQLKYFMEQPYTSLNHLPPGMKFEDYNRAVAQEPAWWEYMTTYPIMSGQMVDPGVYSYWVLRREFKPVVRSYPGIAGYPPNPSGFSDGVAGYFTNVYVKPEDHNDIFANTNGLDNFQTYYRHELKLYQPLSHRFLSY